MPAIIFLIAISIMILIHELGHFLVAKANGLKVEEFGLGYPPRLFGKKIGETIYSLNLIPMGGFVRIWGMERKVKKDKKRAFYTQAKKIQFLILSAGVIMNFVSALGVFSLVYGIQGVPQKIDKVRIVYIADDSPAKQTSLKSDTDIVAVKAGEETFSVNTSDQFIKIAKDYAGSEITLVSQQGEEYQLTPRKDPPDDQGPLGVIVADQELVKVALWKRIPLGIWYGFKEAFFWGYEILKGLVLIIGQLFKGQVPKQITGPIGIYTASRQILKRQGLLSVIHFFAIVSVNLAIVNIVPIPGTDGWHTMLLGLETIRGKSIKEETKTKINQAAMIFILLLSLLIIAADVKKFLL